MDVWNASVRCSVRSPVSKTGLVLGAGGATAWVFHTAVLKTLRDEAGIDPYGADLVVGTSAGASLAAAMRAGVDLDDFYSAATRPPSEEQRQAMRSELKSTRKTVVPLAAGMARHLLPGGDGATMALAGLLPRGMFPTDWLARLPGLGAFDGWPQGLWVPAVKVPDASVVVFGRERSDIPVHAAVEASSSVPGMFRPREIDGELFVDGGVWSSTHADQVVSEGLDRVIISAPMSRANGGVFARNAKRRLAVEVTALRTAGVEVLVVEPSDALNEIARGYPRRRPDAAAAIATHAVTVTRSAYSAA